jgi:3-oxoacyl-(acyl-carrier-protein) synthase
VWAPIAGFASTFQSPNDLHAKCPPHRAVGRAIDASLADAGLPAHCVALVAASGLATIPHDRIEAQAIRQSLGSVPVTAVSSFMGATGAASGAMQLAEVLAAFDTHRIPITLNYERPDPDCPIDVVHGTQIPLERPVAVIVGHSPTGQAAALVVTRPI